MPMRCISSARALIFMPILTVCGQVQDWLYTRDAAKATAAQALALASSHLACTIQPSLSQSSAAVFRSSVSSNIIARDVISSNRSGKSTSHSLLKNHSDLTSSSKQPLHVASISSSRARSSSPLSSASMSIDATITSMVAGGASGTTAMQRHMKRSGARFPSAAAADAGAGASGSRRLNVPAAPAQQLFSVIL